MFIAGLIIVLVVSILYGSILIYMVIQWEKSSFSVNRIESTPLVSVVVCFHNEASHIDRLFDALKAQSYPAVEFIFVDDASEDDTKQLIEKQSIGTLVSLPEHVGKKQALQIGIERAHGTWILCTDADCVMGERWIETIVSHFQQTQADMIIAPVRLSYFSFFSKIQAVEFLSLSAVTACTALMNHPIMCNGANLAFSKAAWSDGTIDLKMDYVSGDDMFLMEHIKKIKGKIVYAYSPKAMVTTEAKRSLNAFFQQRIRWASKSGRYSDREVLVSGWLAVFFTLFPLVLVTVAMIHSAFLVIGVLAWLLKSILDFLFLRRFSSFFLIWFSWYEFLPIALFYPFYFLLVMILSTRGSRVAWS